MGSVRLLLGACMHDHYIHVQTSWQDVTVDQHTDGQTILYNGKHMSMKEKNQCSTIVYLWKPPVFNNFVLEAFRHVQMSGNQARKWHNLASALSMARMWQDRVEIHHEACRLEDSAILLESASGSRAGVGESSDTLITDAPVLTLLADRETGQEIIHNAWPVSFLST